MKDVIVEMRCPAVQMNSRITITLDTMEPADVKVLLDHLQGEINYLLNVYKHGQNWPQKLEAGEIKPEEIYV